MENKQQQTTRKQWKEQTRNITAMLKTISSEEELEE